MIKSELIRRIAEQNPQFHGRDVEMVVNTILTRMADALVAGDRVEIRGLGVLSVRNRRSREGRNPRTGQALTVMEKQAVAFKTSKVMHARLNSSEGSDKAELEARVSDRSRHI